MSRKDSQLAPAPPGLPQFGQMDSSTLLSLCRKHNSQVCEILKSLSDKKVDVQELKQMADTTQEVLNRCSTHYGDLKNLAIPKMERVYLSICEYEKKLTKLLRKGSFVRFLNVRLRGKIDQISYSVSADVQIFERDIRDAVVQRSAADFADDVIDLLDDVRQFDPPAATPEAAAAVSGVFEPRTPPKPLILRNSLESTKRIPDFETKMRLEGQLSIIKDSARREQLLASVSKLPVKPLSSDEIVTLVSTFDWSTGEIGEKSFEDIVCGKSVSTYPRDSLTGKREGDPICDQFCASVYDNRIISVVADGCNWGEEPKEAARKATRITTQYIKRHQHEIRDAHDAALLLFRAFHLAHKSIVIDRTEEDMFVAGTTTMIAGVVLELEQPLNGKPFAFVAASVGDCKAYYWPQNSARLSEITRGNRGGVDARDPGGRIGPMLDGGEPDLRNFNLYFYLCDENDVIVLVSDGVHDNFDPRLLGRTPRELGMSNDDDWEQYKDTKNVESEARIWDWMEKYMTSLVPQPVTVQGIVRHLVQQGIDTTRTSREWMQNNPGKRLPTDYKQFPGKLDHTTCMAFRVGFRRSRSVPQPQQQHSHQRPVRSTSNVGVPVPTSQRGSSGATGSYGLSSSEPSSLDELSLDMPDEPPRKSSKVWDSLFGFEAIVASWSEFIAGLGLQLTRADEESLRTIIDASNTGRVTRFKFQEFLEGFGPLECCVQNVSSITQAAWFRGFTSAVVAKRLLELHPVGTFLIRFSSSVPGNFVLDYVKDPGHVRSVRLWAHPDGGFAAKTEGSSTNQKVFKSIQELVDTYGTMGILTTPFSSSLPDMPWFYGEVSSQEAEELLSSRPAGTFLIRFSQNQGCFAASFVGTAGEIKKGLITKYPGGGFQVNAQGRIFPTLDDLVQHYKAEGYFSEPYQD
eukprot:TRINITY_DN10485_c0_g1_i1.p1 TRINITY_DN10485_c0_g1~~TRINITY_DN10485_c0_g1_i1.p1  ORF type:complete len:913 (+),score=258.32 TRINITY_DN10485_c0_g1_i1:60-2798(+)